MGTHPFLVQIVQVAQGYFGPVYEREVMGFGCRTAAEAIEEATRTVARLDAARGPAPAVAKGVVAVDLPHRAVFRAACATCGVTGVKPGCKRKRCPTCGGRGSIPIEIDAAGKVSEPGRCRWFLLCENEATTTVAHPVLGSVPCCGRCAARATGDGSEANEGRIR